ncbi:MULTISPECIES: single-stranded DNA-binding protein [Holospora]|uniref:Single-stranded DNA-binding protein n=2 Tax=Holospora TaxID=44747 RepID=A0A061JIJ1_9PROT|nr:MULTISPECIES: single-stranded DNA-binding protein [Holospora]ETZ04884.1 single-stranded DNA-binding protein [Holospora undulata HU1]GAJ46822.1 single-stranded DNA-binding protein [Holospora elegans E1]
MSVNKIILIGNLGQDPEIRLMPDGSKVANFSVATSERWKDKNGEVKSVTEWHRVVVFNPKLASIIERYFKKGKKVFVEGGIRTRKWIDKEGREQKTVEVVVRYQGTVTMLDNKNEEDRDLAGPFGSMEEHDCLSVEEDEVPF